MCLPQDRWRFPQKIGWDPRSWSSLTLMLTILTRGPAQDRDVARVTKSRRIKARVFEIPMSWVSETAAKVEAGANQHHQTPGRAITSDAACRPQREGSRPKRMSQGVGVNGTGPSREATVPSRSVLHRPRQTDDQMPASDLRRRRSAGCLSSRKLNLHAGCTEALWLRNAEASILALMIVRGGLFAPPRILAARIGSDCRRRGRRRLKPIIYRRWRNGTGTGVRAWSLPYQRTELGRSGR